MLVHFLQWLKDYASVLSAAATVVYVVLTYRMLGQLHRQSTYELRLRHLKDLKRGVADPIRAWLEHDALPILSGQVGFLRVEAVEIDPSRGVTIREALNLTVAKRVPTWALYGHAKQFHFQNEIEQVEGFSAALDTMMVDCFQFGQKYSDMIAALTEIERKQFPVQGNRYFADSDSMLCVFIGKKLLGEDLSWEVRQQNWGDLLVVNGSIVAAGAEVQLRDWATDSLAALENVWLHSGIMETTRALRRDSERISHMILKMEFTQELPGNCDLLGYEITTWQRAWNWYRSKLEEMEKTDSR